MSGENFKSSVIKELVDRGFIYQATNLEATDELFANNKATVYIGFDSTAKSLHVGSLLQIMLLRVIQKHGHKVIALMGGATTMIGDPSFKDKERQMLAHEQIITNMECIKENFIPFLDFTDKDQTMLVNNYDWFSKIGYLEFLRDYGKLFSVNRMLAMDSVKTRLEREQNLSVLEFNYMLLQAYDFAHLNKEYGCRVQIGGGDQWSNIINGVDLCRRLELQESYGLTTPLITTADGKKMGKTENGAVWLNSTMLSAYDYWQFWRNCDDRDIVKFMKIYTDISCEDIEKLHANTSNINELKIILANHATALLHGQEDSKQAELTAQNTFSNNKSGFGLAEFKITQDDLDNRYIYDIIREANLTKNGAEAKRLIKSGAVKIDDQVITDEMYKIQSITFQKVNKVKLLVGKKKHILLVVE